MDNQEYEFKVGKTLKKLGYQRILKEAKYGGINFDYYAESPTGKKLFMYLKHNSTISIANAVNLYNIKNANQQLQRQSGCEYVIIAPKGMTSGALEVAKKKGIRHYEDLDHFEKEFSSVSV